jgi:hypothetical protein
MKILEIISEDQQHLDEAGLLSTIGLYFSRKFGTKFAVVADDAITQLAAKGRLAGPVSFREVMKHLQGTKLGKQMMSDVKLRNEIVPLIQKEANKVRAPSLWNKLTGASKLPAAGEEVAKRGGFALAYKGLTAGLTAWGLYEMWAPPLQDYWESMDNAKANLDSGSWSIENYHHEENKQLSTLIGRLGAALLITSVPAMMLNNKLTRALLGEYLGPVLGLAMPAAVIYVRKWLNRDDNADGIAAIMMNDYIAGNAQAFGTPIPGLGSLAAKFKQQFVGDAVADPSKATDKLDRQGTAPSGTTTGQADPAGNKTNANGKQDIDSTSSGGKPGKPTDNKKPNAVPDTAVGRKMWDSDPNAVRNFDITGWVTTPGKDNFIMDPKNPNRILPKPIDWRPD